MYKKSVSEIGRSMVEMLGVLAIIGVLSVAGIAGYRYAMDRYIANDVLHESNIRGFDVTANFKGRRLPDIAEIGGYAKYTGTGKPIAVYPNPEDFSWSEYADKCPSEDLCQAFDVEVKGLNKRQCQMIMQSSWELPDAYLVSTGIAGDTSGDGTAPIASVSSSRPIMRTASNADSGLCDEFGEDEQNIAIRFRFVSTFTDFTDEDYESGWEDETTSDDTDGTGGGSSTGGGTGDGTGGTTDGGGTPTPEDPVVPGTPTCTGNSYLSGTSCVECGTNQQVNSTSNGCECKQDYYPAGSCTTKCESPRSWLDGTCKCANGNWNGTSCVTCGMNEVWTGSDCVCDDSSYNSGDSCIQCPAQSTVNSDKNGCICTESNAYWNGNSCVTCGTNQQVNEAQNGCECKTNWHGEGCTTYCDTSVASMSGGTCACKDTTTYWNGQACESCGANKVYENGSCVCDDQSYADGDSCIQCPSGSTPISGGCDCDGDGNWNGSSCITCDTNATFTDNVCKCNNGYSGDGQTCAVCERPRRTNASNTTCDCPSGTIWTGEETNRCEEDDDGSGGVTNLCEAGWVWDSEAGVCVENICSGTADCPYGYVCDITDGQCIKDWECENPHALDISERDCIACANRTWSDADKCVNCDSRKGLILSSGKCVCPAGKVMRLDETTGEYRCQCPENTPEEADEETCECPSGYDNIDENGDGINECVQSCPSDTGFTGLRNSETGNCLCDTSQGYKAESEIRNGTKICVCDNTKDYYPSSSGGCKKCEQTTVEWCNKRNAAGEIDCTYIDTSNWYCGDIQKNGVADGYIAFYVWNPSTKSYCGAHSTLRKNADGSFYCYRCDSALPLHLRTNRNGEGRASENGFCACSGYWAWYNGVNGWRCYPRCAVGKYYYPGINVGNGTSCSGCSNVQVALNGQCNNETLTNQYCAGSTTQHGNKFWWGLWKANTPESCRNGVNIAQDPTPSSVCDVRKGCVYESSTLAGCEFGTKITTTCACSTGGTVGQYCCSTSSYPTANGCVSCTDGTIPNASRTGCEECPANMIAKNGVCTRCDEGYYPNSTQIRCLACPAGTITDAEGLACTVCVDTEKVFDNTTGTCLDPCTQTADCSESTDGMCCDSERKVCRKCIPDDCNANKGFEYADEKCICSAQTPILQNAECVACSSVDENKPYWDGVECVATCPTEKAYVADNVCVESCPMDKPYVDNASCVSECPSDKVVGPDNVCMDVTTWCTQQMQNVGYSTTDFTVTDETITYNKDMTVSTALDISKCNLIVNGTLTVNSGITLKAKNVSATSSSANGINNSGTITATQTVYGKGYSYGIDNKSSGTINANKLDAGQIQSNNAETTTDFLAAIVNYGTINSNVVMCSRDVGINKYTINIGVKNYGKIFADDILGAGYFSQVATVKASTQANNIDVYLCETWADSILVVNDILRTDSLLNAGAISVKKVQTKRADLYNGSVDAEIFSVTEILNNYSTLSANLVYGGDIISQEYTSGMITFGPGKMTAPKIYYCTSYKYGTYSTAPIKKCAETCSGSTPIWNGESCEACPSIRPNWNAEYGICE